MPLFLSDEEFSRCSGNAALVAERADDFIRRLNVELETVRAQADAAAITAEQTCSLLEQKYLTITSDFSDLQSQCSQLQASLDQRLVELADVQAQKSQVHLQCIEKDGEIERLSTETSHLQTSKRQLMQVLEHKDAEISEKNMSIKSYLDKISQLIDNSSQKDARLNEKEAELARVQANCSRLLQEKELIQRQNAWLNDELKDKVDSLLDTRRTIGDLEAQMSSKIADAEREFNDCSSSLKWNKERVRELEGKVTFLQEELRSCKESASANEERFSAELSTVHKLVELYKESSEEWSRKAGELEGVIKALEVHLSQVENDYKDKLEREISFRRQAEKEAEDLKAKLEKCETDIESLRKQNELNLLPLGSFNTESWTGSLESNDNVEDGAIVPKVPTGVSGTALAASLLRDGWSLVKMYTKYQEAVDALRHEQMGRKEAEAVMQRVLYELEEKADVIMEERAEHERMVEAYSAINEKLHESTSEQYNLEKTIQGLKADLKKHERDYQLAQHEITDLRSQVTVLLKECRDIQIRCGSDPHESDEEMVMDAFELNEESDIEKVIRERLLTFKDIHGLVEQNVKLRSLVRNLSHQITDQEAEFKVKFEMELKNHTEEAASKVAAVLQRAEEQTQMIESLHTSVAMYKRLYEEEHKRHSTPPEAAIVSQEDGRTDVRLLIQGSQEAAKRAQEKAAERVRCLEEEFEKSRSKIIALQSERDKLALEAEFLREKVDSIMKESEHKRGELDGVLSRNVEFSQLIVDYQRKLRDSYESLQAAEDQTRKLTMEVSIVKQEKEVLANAEKRASDEIRSLSERVYRLQATLDTIQSAEGVREEGRVVEKGRHEEYLNKLQREWTEAKKELQNERDNVRNLTRERDVPLRDAMKQVEEMRNELASALKAGAAAESRAAVAEARLSDLERMIHSSNSEVGGSGGSASVLTNEIAPTLQISKEEMEKLKEEAKANKEHMMQYKSIAQVNEAALKQMEHAHETYKTEAERLKNSLEAEVLSLRERVSELENQLNLKSAEVASLVSGKEEVLASVSTEVSSLKEEIVVKSSQMIQLETRNSLLEDKWKSEHERWRSAQANYERQVVLQSATIQELTRTSEAFSLLEKEASELRRSSDDLKRENKELESKLLEAKSVLEEITSSSEKKYSELNEQNKLLHERLEALHIQLAEKDRYGRTSGGLGQDPAGDSGLQSVINYLRRSKEIGETEISLLKQEKWRLQSQLESAMKAAESAQATLQADRASLKASMITEEEFKSLQLQIRELNLLRESNEQLREENKHNFEECQRLRELAQKARSEIENLEKELTISQNLVEACKKEIEMHKEEKSQLEKRVTELLERCGSIDVEHYEGMKKEVSQLQEKLKEKDAQIEGIKVLAAQRKDKITQLERDLQTVRSELTDKEKKLQDISLSEEKQRRLASQFKRKADAATKEKEDLAREKQAFLKQLKEKEDNIVKEKQALVKQLEDLKQVERPSGDVNMEQLMKEKEEKDTRIQTLERALQNLRDNLKKERDKRQQSEKTIVESLKRADEGKAKVTNELEMHKQALKQLSDEVEKIKHVEGSLPEGTSVVQLLSGNSLDDLASGYVSALESFEQVAHSLAGQLGARPSSQEATETPLLTPAVAATGAPEGSNTAAAKPTEEKEKASSAPKRAISETTRRVARRLVRPPGPPRSAAAADEPSQDVEMAEGGTQETEAVPAAAAPQQSVRKRQASPAPPEATQEPSDAAAPLIKRSKVQDEATTSQVEPDPVVTEKEGDLQIEESQEKAEEESDPLPAEVGGIITEEVQMDENLDKPEGEAADELGDQAEEAPENDDKEEGEAVLDVADDIVGSPELTTEDTAEVTGGASPGRGAADDVDVEGGEIAGEGEDGEITEEAAEEKNEPAPETTTAAAEAPAVAVAHSEQQGSSSPTPTAASGSVAAPAAVEVAAESKQQQQQQQQQRSSPSSNIVNLRKSAEVGAAERLRNRVISTTAPPNRGGRAGRIIGRGRGRVIGRGKPPGAGGEQGGQGSGASR